MFCWIYFSTFGQFKGFPYFTEMSDIINRLVKW